MPWITSTSTYTKSHSRTDFTGFEDVTIARPKFIYFKAIGLKPNTRHWVFFDDTEVTNYVSTSAGTINDFNNLSRNDSRRNPGEKYISETGFPTALGGPTSEIISDDNGQIDGVFYLQSNSTLNFPTGKRTLSVLDISKFDIEGCTSHSSANYIIDGGIENYKIERWTTTETSTNRYWQEPPAANPPSGGGSSSTGNVGGGTGANVGVNEDKKKPIFVITGNERYQNINGVGYIFKGNHETGGVEIVHKSEELGSLLGTEKLGYGGNGNPQDFSLESNNENNFELAKAVVATGAANLPSDVMIQVGLIKNGEVNSSSLTGSNADKIQLVNPEDENYLTTNFTRNVAHDAYYRSPGVANSSDAEFTSTIQDNYKEWLNDTYYDYV